MLPTPLLHKARPSSPCFQGLGQSQNSLGTAQDAEVYFPSPLPTISFFKMFSFGRRKNVCMSLSLRRPDHTQKTLRSLIKNTIWGSFSNILVVGLVDCQIMVIIIKYLCRITCFKRHHWILKRTNMYYNCAD